MSPAGVPLPLLAVTGLHAEAKIAAAPGVKTIAGGGDATRLALLLQGSLAGGARAVISFGIAGGLAQGLPAGTVVVADSVDDGETRWETDAQWRAGLLTTLPRAVRGGLAGVDRPVAGALGKAALHSRCSAIAVDMESHIAARLAAQHRVPFVALRVVADPAERTLPRAALVGMRPDGTTNALAVLRALVQRPRDIPALIQTALDARAAFAALAACRAELCTLFGLDDASAARYPEITTPEHAEAALLVLSDSAVDRA